MTQHKKTKTTEKKAPVNHSKPEETYPTLKEMIVSGIAWAKQDYHSCPSVLKRIIEMGLYSTCLICLGAVWTAYFYRCSCELDLSDSQQPKVSMVLYQNGRAFISQTQEMDLKQGIQTISFGIVPQKLIVPSATVSGQNLSMQSMNFNPADEHHSYFEHAQTQAIGKPVTLLWEVWKDGNKTELTKPARLLASEYGTPVLLVDGKVQKGTDAKILYPAPTQQQQEKPELTFTVLSSTSEPQTVDFSYMSSGFEWRTFYNLYLDEHKHSMDIQGQVNLINRSGVAYHNVNLDFVLGDIHTLEYATPTRPVHTCEIENKTGLHIASDKFSVNGQTYEPAHAIAASKEFSSARYAMDAEGSMYMESNNARGLRRTKSEVRDLKDYFVYHVPVPVQLNENAPTMATFLTGKGLPYHKEYLFRDLVSLGAGNERKNIAPELDLIFNTKKLGLPLPKGDFRVFNKQKDKVFFVGEAKVNKITMPTQDAKVNMGEALDVYADTYLADYKSLSDEESLYTYAIDLRNVSNEAKDVIIEQALYEGEYILKQAQPSPSQAIPTKIKWQLTLPAHGKQSILFSVLKRDLSLIRRKEELKFKENLCKDRAVIVHTTNK